MKKIIRLTETDIKNIVKETVKKILSEEYHPYGNKKYSDYSSEESKALYDYDPNFAISHTLGTNHYEPAPLGNIPNNEPDFPEDEQPYQYWSAIRKFDNRLPIEPSIADKKEQMKSDWNRLKWRQYNYPFEDGEDDYNFNVHDNAFDASGANGRVDRLNAFDDDEKGKKAKKFNGTLNSLSEE